MPIKFKPTGKPRHPCEVVGESNYTENLNTIAWDDDLKQLRYRAADLTAYLVLEDDNPGDPNAVRVEINYLIVGYLSGDDAILYRQSLARLGMPSEIGQCQATIAGRRDRDYDALNLGVWIDIDPNNLQIDSIVERPPRPSRHPRPPAATPAPTPPQSPATPKHRPRWLIPGIIAAAITAFCCLCLAIALIYNQTPAGQAAITQRSADRTATYQVISTPVP